mmetsp:Transcript_7627/g.15209  ORF Transcript_7627/g.15209 Transcript_7627/m.15209 type:complete len:230 (-) Transcript_7627:139-828(-)
MANSSCCCLARRSLFFARILNATISIKIHTDTPAMRPIIVLVGENVDVVLDSSEDSAELAAERVGVGSVPAMYSQWGPSYPSGQIQFLCSSLSPTISAHSPSFVQKLCLLWLPKVIQLFVAPNSQNRPAYGFPLTTAKLQLQVSSLLSLDTAGKHFPPFLQSREQGISQCSPINPVPLHRQEGLSPRVVVSVVSSSLPALIFGVTQVPLLQPPQSASVTRRRDALLFRS